MRLRILIILLIVLFSCNMCVKEKPVNINDLLKNNVYPKYLNIIDNDICFRCNPAFYQVAKTLKLKNINPKQIIYIFPSQRNATQEYFLNTNFGFSQSEITTIFNTKTYNKAVKDYNVSGLGTIIKFTGYKNFKINKYPRSFSKDFIENL
ncbi:MAG: hypothetical protein U9R42_02805 [Bacteroidota bacterium]|nr:hypothetical protein [Bacteroidota bacterium]